MVDTDPTCNRHLDIAVVGWLAHSRGEIHSCVKKMVLQVISIMASSPQLDRRSDQIAQCAATVTIAEGTTTIADRAFEGCVQMRTLVLPSTLTRYCTFQRFTRPWLVDHCGIVFECSAGPTVCVAPYDCALVPPNSMRLAPPTTNKFTAYQSVTQGWLDDVIPDSSIATV
jgi:hypothetical protein